MSTFRKTFLVCLPVALLAGSLFFSSGADAEPKPAGNTPADKIEPGSQLKPTELDGIRKVHQFGPTLLCGQPDKEALKNAAENGIEVVITLRKESEINWDEADYVESLSLKFHQLGFQLPESLSDDILDKSRELLRNTEESPVMLHCASANRVGAVWAAHRVLDHGVDWQTAMKEAKQVGLRNPGYAEQVQDYIKRKQVDSNAESK
ncbi:hypothetical protein Pla110_39230 [Polystyrenella longa]|uniref:Beta-lactamase hydrolase-like protein n=1 Tax=Polystyrenella longa TaxID=2528007 RepID=A0A518CSH7_9PLAN|nr:hypothetical protein [Polystyrenella longa]QDU82168.1 hypothetical protein Pla110_39230 [Polystyrenella longa]